MTDAIAAHREEPLLNGGSTDVLVGIDVIELVSTSMYIDPLTVFREYIQNSADAIDQARKIGVLSEESEGRVDIIIDQTERRVLIRDNGVGLGSREFVDRMTAFGASEKRGHQFRGFRGVGRLAALGHCQELVFRSRTSAEQPICEIVWDSRRLRSALRASFPRTTLSEAVGNATSHRTHDEKGYPDRFFEVEMRAVVRHGKDDMLNENAICQYLAQVGPVPFSPSFKYRNEICEFLNDISPRSDLHVYVNGDGPVYRPHSNTFQVKDGLESNIAEVRLITIPGTGDGPAAKGWVLHHDYLGALPQSLGVRGLRLRSGGMQIGEDSMLKTLFPESRFNSWTVGEFHIVDTRIVPNGRRDQYETNVHYANVLNHLSAVAREISSRCRSQSQHRQLVRRAELLEHEIDADLAVLSQGALTPAAHRRLVVEVRERLDRLHQLGSANSLFETERRSLETRHSELSSQLAEYHEIEPSGKPLEHLPPRKRNAYKEVFSLLYDCASDVRGAKELVDRVLARL